MAELPAGTVTFLFTDIEGSTRLLQQLGGRYASVLADHHRLLRSAFTERGGTEVQDHGDGFYYSFPSAKAAVQATVAAQRAVAAHLWPDGVAVRVRMGLHTGEPVGGETGLVGIDIHRAARICAAGHGGQILISEATRALVAGDLPDGASLRDLGEHRLKDLVRAERLFQVVVRDLPDDFPPLRSLTVLPNNLPHQWTSFIGREREIADLRRSIAAHRLVTLTGIGGAGKTRLALQVAADLLGHFPDGVWLVELAALLDPAIVPHAVAAALGVKEEPKRPLLQTLTAYLRSRHLLLILDNCEHLIAACAHLAEALLRDCQRVRILATSREALGIPGEVTYPVPSLSIPEVPSLDLERLTTFAAVRLFVDRASAAFPAFALKPQGAGAVATICRRLDGIPLAIELVAPRVKAMTLEQIAEGLQDRFRLLTGGSRTALPRHQTLHAAMDWSYQLLTARERATHRRLSVFAGGFTVEAAEVVCAGDGLAAADVLELVTRLVEKSLAVFEESAGRYRLLETVRQFARDRLLESEEVPTVRMRHLDWFLALAERAEPASRGPEQETWLNRLEGEHDNLRAALEWALEGPHADMSLRLAGALGWFWIRRGSANEGREWLDRALAADGPATAERAKALFWVAMAAYFQLDWRRLSTRAEEYRALARELRDRRHEAHALRFLGIVAAAEGSLDVAEALCEESHGVLRELKDTWGIASTLHTLANLAAQRGDLARARALYEERLVLERALGNKAGIAMAMDYLGRVLRDLGDFERARGLLEESLAIRREIGDRISIPWPFHQLGLLEATLGNYPQAARLLEEAIALYRDVGHTKGVLVTLFHVGYVALAHGDFDRAASVFAESLALSRQWEEDEPQAVSGLGLVALYQGDLKRARALLDESLQLYRQTGAGDVPPGVLDRLAFLALREGNYDEAVRLSREALRRSRQRQYREPICRFLERFAIVLTARDQADQAVGLFGAAEAFRVAARIPMWPIDRPEYERSVAAVRSRLAEAVFRTAWAEGHGMTLEQAVECALQAEA